MFFGAVLLALAAAAFRAAFLTAILAAATFADGAPGTFALALALALALLTGAALALSEAFVLAAVFAVAFVFAAAFVLVTAAFTLFAAAFMFVAAAVLLVAGAFLLVAAAFLFVAAALVAVFWVTSVFALADLFAAALEAELWVLLRTAAFFAGVDLGVDDFRADALLFGALAVVRLLVAAPVLAR